jgi:hypothetical protein
MKAHKYLSIAAGQWQNQKFVFQPNLCVLCDGNAVLDHIEMFQEIGLDFNFESQKYRAVWYCHSVSNFWMELFGEL